MAITSAHLKITVRGLLLSQVWEVVQWYRPVGAAFLTAEAVQVGEAYWNDIKTLFRAIVPVTGGNMTVESVFVSEPGESGAYGEYAVPAGEKLGTRAIVGQGDNLPPFVAVGVRLTVGTRATRPGHKRFGGWFEADQANGVVNAPIVNLVGNLMVKYTSVINLGAPVATGTLTPEIVSIDRDSGEIVHDQIVTGYVINPYMTTQNSRKIGRGA